jgi:diguanylate cyclase (GGDEF)-like protein
MEGNRMNSRQGTVFTSPERPASQRAESPASPDAGGPRETNGITSRLVLLYVERAGGRKAVAEVLARAGLEGREAQLLDENYWFSWDEKLRLFEAAANVLDDPEVMIHVGEVALELNVGAVLKLALRALGSPGLVYENVVRANAKFTGSHTMELLEVSRDHARIRYRDLNGHRYHPLDCQYNRGLLACIPALFGLPFARITHPACGCHGADACVYEIRWENRPNEVRSTLPWTFVGAAALVGPALLAPPLLPAGAAVATGAAAVAVVRVAKQRRSRWRGLEQQVYEQSEVARNLTGSLQDLVSELRLEEVLAKVTRNARSTVAGKEFALLVGEDGLRCHSSTGVPRMATATLERWADDVAKGLEEPTTVDDVTLVSSLAPLAADPNSPFGSICAAPLIFRGERLGVLVALATQARTFLPRDIDLIQSYAAQAAIALANARLYEAQQDLARRDPLTGLFNHRVFHEQMSDEIERSSRYGSRFGIVLFDLERFKEVNDARGHAEGDRVLRTVGEALASSCRGPDRCFRVGGDEFALILPEADADAAIASARRAREAVAALPNHLDTAFGIAVWPDDGTGKDTLLEVADARLYAMKRDAAFPT